MLQILRNKAQSTIIQAIVVIIALVFIFWGVGTNMMNNREAAITVNGEEISFQDFQIAYDRAYQNIADQFGGTLPKGLAETLGIKQQVINQLVQAALLRQGASRMGIIVSEEEIQSTINGMVQFQESGGFSLEKYKSLLAANRLTPHKFETNMRFDMLAEKALRDIGKFAALTSEYEVEELYRQDNEKVSVAYTRISPASFTDQVQLDEAELATWFESASENYRSEPMTKLKYLDFSFAEVGKKIIIDDAQVQAYYNDNISRFTTPEKRHARHILLKAGDEDSEEVHKEKNRLAAEVASLVKASDDFATLARQFSEGPSAANGGDLGFFSRDQMVPAFADAVFTMQAGAISEVVQTRFGYHIIKLEAIQPAVTRTLDEVKAEIIASLQKKEAQPLAFQSANSAYEGIIGAGSLQAYAQANPDQPIIQTGFFAQSAPPENLSLDREFLEQAFALKAGELSSLIKTTGGYYIIFAEDVQEPQTPALDDVREDVVADFTAEKAARKAMETASNLLDKTREGAELSKVAADMGLVVEESGFIGRDGSADSAFPPSLTEQAFMLSAQEPLPQAPSAVGDDYYVFSFVERQVPEVSDQADLEQYRQTVLRNKQQELLSSFISNLEDKAEITIHNSL